MLFRSNLASALGLSKGLLNSTLVSQLGAILSQFDGALKEMNTRAQTSGNNTKLLNDVRGLKALLGGISEQAATSDSAEALALQANLASTTAKLNSIMDNLVAQSIMSQKGREELNYLYQQVPNTSPEPPKDFEIVVKRDGQGPESSIDY